MKLKIFTKIGEILLGRVISDDEPRADMYLPVWILSMGIMLSVAGITIGVIAFVLSSVKAAAVGVVLLIIGIVALLCWKNQSIVMLDDDSFEYRTMFGRKKVYNFSDLERIRKNNDSMTMFIGGGKVHIESSAILTKRLIDRINRQLEMMYGTSAE